MDTKNHIKQTLQHFRQVFDIYLKLNDASSNKAYHNYLRSCLYLLSNDLKSQTRDLPVLE